MNLSPAQNFPRNWPRIIQGGMGIGVSGWQLARAVSMAGELGVVSGTAIDTVMVRRLQDGDPGGHLRRAFAHFPFPEITEGVIRRYFRPEGRLTGEGYRLLPMWQSTSGRSRLGVNVLAAFTEVFLAREGHDGIVGMNLLTKVQLPNLSALYGAMLAGVDYVLMGAGIPREIPLVLDRLADHQSASLRFDVEGVRGDEGGTLTFDPGILGSVPAVSLQRPRFLAIVSGDTLATILSRKATGTVDGFIVEGHIAGGHNAPPRGKARAADTLEPLYDARDEADLGKMIEIGRPFWLAGGMGEGTSLSGALAMGAAGIQVGTLFALCSESGLEGSLRRSMLRAISCGEVEVRTDGQASPTGFPFKVASGAGLPDPNAPRKRICDLGYLRTAYLREDGRIGYRCPAEPIEDYLRKGGKLEDTIGRRCLCNGLLAAVGQGQLRDSSASEPPLLTSGSRFGAIPDLLQGREEYSALEIITHLKGGGALASEVVETRYPPRASLTAQ